MNLQRTKQELQSNQAKTRLQHISRTGIYKPTNVEAWAGTNIVTSLRHHPNETRTAVATITTQAVQFIDANNTPHSFNTNVLCVEIVYEEVLRFNLEGIVVYTER